MTQNMCGKEVLSSTHTIASTHEDFAGRYLKALTLGMKSAETFWQHRTGLTLVGLRTGITCIRD